MDKVVVGVILVNGEQFICEVEEIFSEEVSGPNCLLVNPYKINENEEMVKWPAMAKQNTIEIHSRNVLSIVDPKKEIVEKYLELTA